MSSKSNLRIESICNVTSYIPYDLEERMLLTPEDRYVQAVVSKYKIKDDRQVGLNFLYPLIPEHIRIKNIFTEPIKDWAGQYLNDIFVSGSRAKGTAIKGGTDVDLFISLKADTPATLKEIFNLLHTFCANDQGLKTRKQNVSIGVEYQGKKIDLVPAKQQKGYINYHSLYKNKSDSWTQTNITEHINLVKNSGRIDDIVALKIWRQINNLDFPSIYLELTVLEVLTNKVRLQPAKNFETIMEYLRDEFVEKRVVDPCNINNIISDDLYKYEKEAIAKKAKETLKMTWERAFY